MKTPPCIALLTDFGNTDIYAGVLKAVIDSIFPDGRAVDLSHGVEPQNILQGAMMLEAAYSYFPKGTIFICVVDPGVGTERKILAARTRDYFFIGPDNGLLAPALGKETKREVRLVKNPKFFRSSGVSSTFHGRDIMAPAAAYLAKSRGKIFSKLGPVVTKIQRLLLPAIQKKQGNIRGTVLFFDHYGNAITNIRKEDASAAFWKQGWVSIPKRSLGSIRNHYQESRSQPLALFNSFSQLEIAWPGGSAKERLKLKKGTAVHVERNYEKEI